MGDGQGLLDHGEGRSVASKKDSRFYRQDVALSVTPVGYKSDSGADYDYQSTYGWSVATPTMAIRNSSATTDPNATGTNAALYLSQATFTNAVWEAQVPNGQYRVRVICGDAQTFGTYSLNIEGFTNAVSGTTTASQSWLDKTVVVVVTDGNLTISSSTTGILNWIQIDRIEPFSVHVDFGVATSGANTYIPGQPNNITDMSQLYGQRNGYTYGWSVADTNVFTRIPDAVVAPVAPYNSYGHVVAAGTRTWEIAVPNGSYKVRVVSGDASGTAANLGLHEATVEGQTLFSSTLTTATAASHFVDGTGYVVVKDGKLSLALPPGSTGKLQPCFMDITGGVVTKNVITPPDTSPITTNRSTSWIEATQPTASGAGSGNGAGPSSFNKVNLASGAFTHDHGSDLFVRNPVGPDISFGVSYNSALTQNSYQGIVGVVAGDYQELRGDRLHGTAGLPGGWTHNYDVHIEATNSTGWNTLRLYQANGLAEDLNVVLSGSPAKPTGKITPQAGSSFAVVGVASTTVGKWTSITVISSDGSRMTFLPGTAGGDVYRLSQIANQLGQAVQLSYDSY